MRPKEIARLNLNKDSRKSWDGVIYLYIDGRIRIRTRDDLENTGGGGGDDLYVYYKAQTFN